MECDRAFASIENKYKQNDKISCPEEYKNIVCSLEGVKHKTLISDVMLDLKQLTNEKYMSFLHNTPSRCLFSKCRTVYLSNSYPNSMALRYWDSKKEEWEHETVLLADNDWPISKMTTPTEFQQHYLSKNGKTSEEIETLLPKLKEDKYAALLPKKFKPGEVYKLGAKKMKDLNQLDKFLNKAGHDWFKLLKQRQNSDKTKAKIPQNRKDPKLHTHKYNALCDAPDAFDLETICAKRVGVSDEDIEEDCAERVYDEEDGNHSSSPLKKRKTATGAEKQKKDQKVLAKKSRDIKSKPKNNIHSDFPEDEATSSSIGDKKDTQEKQVLAEKSTGFSKSDTVLTDTKSKRARPKTLMEDQIHSILYSSTDNTTSANTTPISTTTTTSTRTMQVGLTRSFKRSK